MTDWKAGGWRARSRSTAAMYGMGALLVAISMLRTPPAAAHRAGILAVAVVAAVTAIGVLGLGPRYTETLSHAATVSGSLLIAVIVALAGGGVLSAIYGVFLVWVAQYSAVFYSRPAAVRHVGLATFAHGLAMWAVPSGQRLLTWGIITGTCQVVLYCYGLIDRLSSRLRGLVERSGGVIAITDVEFNIKYAGGPVERVLGYAPAELIGTSLLALIHPEDASHALRVTSQVANSEAAAAAFEARLRRRGGDWLYTEATVESALGDVSIGGLVLTIRDIAERKRLEADLLHQAFHDSLTHLPNRALFRDRVEHALARSARTGWGPAVLFVDLDDFKSVNDSLGHGQGDELLIRVAARLAAGVRAADTVARLGGDEFAILLEDAPDSGDASTIAERLIANLRAPLVLDDVELVVGASVGVAVATTGLEDAEELLRNADAAMYEAKRAGKGRVGRFEPGMHHRVVRRLQLKNDLWRAVERGELSLVYQPTFSLQAAEIHGVEALIRWDHPEFGRLSPAEFIPLAEETGAILDIGRWVLEEACSQAQRWSRDAAASWALLMNVNVSARQLERTDLLMGDVQAALEASGLDPARLVLEITESVLLGDVDGTVQCLREIRQLGVQVAIDDFGTGYSSLSYLNRLPVDILKIDKSFVDQLGDGPQQRALVETIVRFGRILGAETVAEGIEEPEQLEELRALDCDLGQGYLFAAPMGPDALTHLISEFGRGRRSSTSFRGDPPAA